MIVGLSGSGKSTYISKHFNDCVVISQDDIRTTIAKNSDDQSNNRIVLDIAMKQLQDALRKNVKHVVLDSTHLRSDIRKKVFGLVCDYHGLVKCVLLNTTVQQCIKNDTQRRKKGLHYVGGDAIVHQSKRFQMPVALEEYHIIEIV